MGHTLNLNNFKSTTFQRPNLIEPTSWRVPKAMSLTHVDYTGSLLTCSRTNGLTILNKCLSFPFFSINYSYSTVRTFFFFFFIKCQISSLLHIWLHLSSTGDFSEIVVLVAVCSVPNQASLSEWSWNCW